MNLTLRDITQITMTAAEARVSGMFEGQGDWFAEWCIKHPREKVYAYTFGGIHGGFIYGEVADFETLTEFEQQSEIIANRIWVEYRAEAEFYLCKC